METKWREPLRWRIGDKKKICELANISGPTLTNILHRRVDYVKGDIADRVSVAAQTLGYDITFEDVLRPKFSKCKWFY